LIALVSLIPIYGFALLFHIFAKRLVSVSIFFAISFIIATIFLFGMVDFLKYGTYFVFYGGILSFFLMLIKNNTKVLNFIISIPSIIYLVVSITYLYLMQDAHFFFWDEYSHWGAFIKEMYYFGHFYDANSVAAHLRYPPGISIWDYFIVLPTGYKESSIYFAYFLILFSSVLMIYEKLKWKQIHWIVLIFIFQMVIFATYGHWFSSIYVDHVVGAIFAGMVLAYMVDKYTYKELMYFIFPAIAIVLVKEIGLFFLLSFVGLVLLISFYKSKSTDNIWNRLKNIKKIILVCFIIFISTFLVLKAWNIRQDSLGIRKESQTISGIVKNLILPKKVFDKATEDEIKKRFWKVVNYQQLHKEKISLNYNEFSYSTMGQYKKELKLTTTGSLLFIFIFFIFIYFVQNDKEYKAKSLILCGYLIFVSISYLLILYFSIQVAFGGGALRIPSYVRYMNTSILPLLMIMVYVLTPAFNNKYNTILRKGINAKLVLLGIIFLVFSFITKPYIKPLYSQFENPFRKKLGAIIPKILENIPMKSKVLVVFPVRNNGSLNNILKYAMIPARATITKYDFPNKKTHKEVLEEYTQYDYIWFVSLNKEIIEKSQQILKLKGKNRAYMLYKLKKQNNQVYVKAIL